jgi:hypothetical protein
MPGGAPELRSGKTGNNIPESDSSREWISYIPRNNTEIIISLLHRIMFCIWRTA